MAPGPGVDLVPTFGIGCRRVLETSLYEESMGLSHSKRSSGRWELWEFFKAGGGYSYASEGCKHILQPLAHLEWGTAAHLCQEDLEILPRGSEEGFRDQLVEIPLSPKTQTPNRSCSYTSPHRETAILDKGPPNLVVWVQEIDSLKFQECPIKATCHLKYNPRVPRA